MTRMISSSLRPPLPRPLSHDGIVFFLDQSACKLPLPDQVISAIAAALQEMLPGGDLRVDGSGELVPAEASGANRSAYSLWYHAGLLAGIDRVPAR